jgi:hypothetical protein
MGTLPLLACAHGAASDPGAVGWTSLTSGEVASTRLDEPQIAEILRVALTAAIEESSVTAPGAPDIDVAEYANAMHDQFRQVLTAERALLEERQISPRATETSRKITFESEAAEWQLLGQAGRDVERTFLGRQVAFQHELLEMIDAQLLPAVRDDAQRRTLLELRPVVERSLRDASRLQASIAAKPSAG